MRNLVIIMHSPGQSHRLHFILPVLRDIVKLSLLIFLITARIKP